MDHLVGNQIHPAGALQGGPLAFSAFTVQTVLALQKNAIEEPQRPHDGETICLEINKVSLTDTDRTVIGVLGTYLKTLYRLVKHFMQAESSSTCKFGGSSFGLATPKKQASLMGDDLTVSSEAGAGSIFRFSFETMPCRVPGLKGDPPGNRDGPTQVIAGSPLAPGVSDFLAFAGSRGR